MEWFKRPQRVMEPKVVAASRPSWLYPSMPNIAVTDIADAKMLKLLRDNIPPLQRALTNYCALVGELVVVADEPLKADIDAFLNSVRVNQFSRGWKAAQDMHIRNQLTYGRAAMEIVPSNAGDSVYALACIEPDTLMFKPRADGCTLDLRVFQLQDGYNEVELDPFWLCINLNDAESHPSGVSLFRSIPFCAQILLGMEEALGKCWERFGVPSFNVNWTPPEGFHDPAGEQTAAIMENIQAAFTAAMAARKEGKVRDFFSAGDVSVDVVGAVDKLLDFVDPARSLMEQVVAATGQPPWMLGFSWSTTERLSDNQADMLTSAVKGLQGQMLTQWQRIVQRHLDMRGVAAEFDLQYDAVNLYDEKATAEAASAEAVALATRESVARKLWQTGVYTQEQYAEATLGEAWDGEIALPMTEPPVVAPVKIEKAQPADDDMQGDESGGMRDESGGTGDARRRPFQASRAHEPCAICSERFDATVTDGGEQPKTRAIARAIRNLNSAIVDGWDAFQEDLWRRFDLPRVEFSAFEPGPMNWGPDEEALFDAAADIFLDMLFGPDRTPEGFVGTATADGVIQEHAGFAYRIGVGRVAEMTGAAAAAVVPDRDTSAFENFLRAAFNRLSDNGAKRLGHQLDGLKKLLSDAIAQNVNPLSIARQMADEFEGYRRWEWERLARTEVAFAQNAGQMDEFEAEGFATGAVRSDPPPWHPNCLCALTIDAETERVLFDISALACPVCQSKRGENSA